MANRQMEMQSVYAHWYIRYVTIVITTKTGMILQLPCYMRKITVGNFICADGRVIWDMSSGRMCGQTGCSDLQASIVGYNNSEKCEVLVDTQ